MSNKYRYRHNDSLLYLQHNNKLSEINEELDKKLRTKNVDIYDAMLDNIVDLILNLGKPSFKNRQDNTDFDSEEYNQNIKEIDNDIRTTYNMLNNLQDMLKINKNYGDLFYQSTEKKVKEIEKYVNDLDIYMDKKQKNIINISENFGSKVNIDTANSNIEIMTQRGIITLENESDKENIFDEDTKIKIMDNSNGYPGRLHKLKENYDKEASYYITSGEIFPEDKIDRSEKEPHFYSEETPYLHTANLIDEDSDTHFEYEICNFEHNNGISNEETSKALPGGKKLYGTRFTNGELWAREPKGDTLELHLKLQLNEPKKINFIDIEKYKILSPQYEMPKLKKLKIAPDLESQPHTVNKDIHRQQKFARDYNITVEETKEIYEDDTTKNNTITFPPQEVQVVIMVFEQTESYDCPLGHVFFKEINTEDSIKTLFVEDKSDIPAGKRIAGMQIKKKALINKAERSLDEIKDQHNKDISDKSQIKGLSSTSLTSMMGPVGMILGSALTANQTIYSDISGKLGRENIISGIDILDGWRYAISLSNIFAADIDYAESSQLISENQQLPGVIKKVEVQADDYIPEQFYQSKQEKDWIEYKFSLDDGETWHDIALSDSQSDDKPNRYYVNTQEDLIYIDDPQAEIIETEETANTFKSKIVLKRPTDIEDAEKYSPRINRVNYQLSLSNGGADDEY